MTLKIKIILKNQTPPVPVAPVAESDKNTVLVVRTQETDVNTTSEPDKEKRKTRAVICSSKGRASNVHTVIANS